MGSRITVEVWSSLAHLFGSEMPRRLTLEVSVEGGATLAGLLRQLGREHPRFGQTMYKPDTTEPSGRVSVVINDRLPELLSGYETPLSDGDRVILVQAYTGG